MIKDDLKQLSEETFRDNDNGEIEPRGHRSFNNRVIDAMGWAADFISDGEGNKFLADDGSYKVIEEIDLTAIETDILPKEPDTLTLGSEERPFNTLFAGKVNTIAITRGKGESYFLSGDGEYRELNSSWEEIRQYSPIGNGKTEVDWCVVGDALILSGILDAGSAGSHTFKIDIPEKYRERMKDSYFTTLADVYISSTPSRRKIGVSATDEGFFVELITENVVYIGVKIHLTPLVIPLLREEVQSEVVGEQSGFDYSEWDYSLVESGIRSRIVTPYTQIVYANESLGEKVYGQPNIETDPVVDKYNYPLFDATNKLSTQRTRFVFGDGDFYCLDDEAWNGTLGLYTGPSEGGSPTEVPFTGEIRVLTDPDIYPLFITSGSESKKLFLGNPDLIVEDISYNNTVIIQPVGLVSTTDFEVPGIIAEVDLPDFVIPDPANKSLVISNYSALPASGMSYPLEIKIRLSETTQYDENGKVMLEIIGSGTYKAMKNPLLSIDSGEWRISIKQNYYTGIEVITEDFYVDVPHPSSATGSVQCEMGFGATAVIKMTLTTGESATYSFGEEVPKVTFNVHLDPNADWISFLRILTPPKISSVGTVSFSYHVTANLSSVARSTQIEFRATSAYGNLSEVLTSAYVLQNGIR